MSEWTWETWIHYSPAQQHSLLTWCFLVHSMPRKLFKKVDISLRTQNMMTLFRINRSRAQFVPNITTLAHTLWCKDACSVYNVTTRKCRVVLSSWSVFKGHKEQTLFIFALHFLLFVKCNSQIVRSDDCFLQTLLGGRGWGLPGGGGGGRGDCGTRGMFWVVLGCPTGRIGKLGEVGSSLAVKGLHTDIWK